MKDLIEYLESLHGKNGYGMVLRAFSFRDIEKIVKKLQKGKLYTWKNSYNKLVFEPIFEESND
jgi:hypothetical protein